MRVASSSALHGGRGACFVERRVRCAVLGTRCFLSGAVCLSLAAGRRTRPSGLGSACFTVNSWAGILPFSLVVVCCVCIASCSRIDPSEAMRLGNSAEPQTAIRLGVPFSQLAGKSSPSCNLSAVTITANQTQRANYVFSTGQRAYEVFKEWHSSAQGSCQGSARRQERLMQQECADQDLSVELWAVQAPGRGR